MHHLLALLVWETFTLQVPSLSLDFLAAVQLAASLAPQQKFRMELAAQSELFGDLDDPSHQQIRETYKMPNYYILDGNKIVNIIIADTKEIAEQVTGLAAVEQIPGEARNPEWEFSTND